MKYPRNAKIFRGQLEAAPLAGVFILLVIFVLLHSNLVFRPGVRIELPADAGGEPAPGVAGPTAVVSIDRHGQVFYEGQIIREEDLSVQLRLAAQRHPDVTLIVQADREVTVDAFYRLTKLASLVGVRSYLLAARPETPEDSIP